MIRALVGDITRCEGVEAICNAANATGPMGRGVAGAIRKAGGSVIQKEAAALCKEQDIQPGELYVTGAGSLPYSRVIHLVTMKKPGGFTSYEIVEKCLLSLVAYCEAEGISRVALPALSTGVGGLDPVQVAERFRHILEPHPSICFTVIDINEAFIREFPEQLPEGRGE
jgi:O-acetyl-ADP-ribose deacetylase